MKKYDTVTLITESPEARGVHEDHEDAGREVFCTVKSVGMREIYEAMAHNKHPELVFELSQDFEYRDEKRLIYHGVKYDILRTYVTEADGIELVAERMVE